MFDSAHAAACFHHSNMSGPVAPRPSSYLFESEGLVLLKGLLRQRAQLSDLLHALLLLLQQHALPVGHLLQLLGVMVDGVVLLLLNVLPALHALDVILDLSFRLVNQRVQIWKRLRTSPTQQGPSFRCHIKTDEKDLIMNSVMLPVSFIC